MHRLKFVYGLLLLAIFSCTSEKSRLAEEQFDFSQFDYFKKIDVSMTWDEILELLPPEKKSVLDSDIGLGYEWKVGNVFHAFNAYFYGHEHYAELTSILRFDADSSIRERVMIVLQKINEDKYGAPYNYSKGEFAELVQWKEVRMNGEYIVSLFHDFEHKQIIFESSILDRDDLDFHDGIEGQWIQTGPEGEWIWVPD